MTQKEPRINSLQPIVLADKRRVTFELVVENLPALAPNVMFMSDPPDPPSTPPHPNSNAPSPYPHIELSILDGQRRQVASLFIIEHKEKHTALTLHLPAPDLRAQYIARAEMTRQDQILDVVEVPFTLQPETTGRQGWPTTPDEAADLTDE